jgi:hypothetical protein
VRMPSWRKPPPAPDALPPRRARLPYGHHPILDLFIMMDSLAENQVRLARIQLSQFRRFLVGYVLMFLAYLLMFVAFVLKGP